jgi:hypothetical protein
MATRQILSVSDTTSRGKATDETRKYGEQAGEVNREKSELCWHRLG